MAINVSEKWSNGHGRSFRGFDPDDNKVEEELMVTLHV
jgi:hypothetical protein